MTPQAAPSPINQTGPVMDVVAPPPPEPVAAAPTEQPSKTAIKPAAPATRAPKQPKDHSPNVTLAIVATVIIVIGLGLLTVFAYLKQTNSL